MYNITANTIFTGKSLIYLPTCHSTNDYASGLISNESTLEGTLVITPQQTAGKGQWGNTWESESGKNLTFSLIFKPSFLAIANQFYLNIISSLAVRATVQHFLKINTKVKWPNDIYLNNKKISGILIQNSIKKSSIGASIIGIGLNVNQEIFSDKKAISMKNYSSIDYSQNEVLCALLENIEAYYLKLRSNKLKELSEEYKSHLYRLGEEHPFKTDSGSFQGKIMGINEEGKLIIREGEEYKAFSFKEVEFLW